MQRRRKITRSDNNQAEIVADLRRIGASVEVLSDVGGGFVDLIVGFGGKNYLFEVKRPGETLSLIQHRFHAYWQGQINIIRTTEDALRIMGYYQ